MKSIQWHQDSLRNQLAYLKRLEDDLQRKQQEIARIKADVEHYQSQIDEAVKQGKDSFDPDRFMKRKPLGAQ